ncbi:MAG TPA: gluconokinase [Chthoniobacterales bacterium]
MTNAALIIIGVSGSGKSETGTEVARRLNLKFLDADDYHSAANKDKMHRGIPLTDEDRSGWLANLHEALRQELDAGRSCVLACSALKRAYREILKAGLPNIYFFYLKVDHDVVARRLASRTGHFFNQALLDSQFATLEEPQADEAFVIDENRPPEEVVQDVIKLADQKLGLKAG